MPTVQPVDPPLAERPTLSQATLLATMGVGTYMSALNGSSVNAILPVLGQAFGAEVSQVEWVITAYLLVQSGLLLTFGRLGDLYGHKPIYVWGFAVFVLASGLCGLAPALPFLVGARILQAVGGAMLFSSSPAILTRSFPPRQRGRALGLYATMVYVGLASGPPLGGWLAAAWSWRAVFYVAVPFGLLALVLSQRFVPRDAPGRRAERFDLAGAVTYVVGLVLVLLALNQGHAWGWTSPSVLGCFVLGLLVLLAFVRTERRVPSPMLDLDLFRNYAFAAPVVSSVLNYMCASSTFFLMPFYLIQGRDLDPARAGLVLIAQPLVMALTASFSGALSDRIGSRIPATTGMALLSLGLFALSRVGETTPFNYVVAALGLIGLGIGLFTSPNNSTVMGAVPPGRRGVASGVVATARTLGNVLGIGVAGAIFSTDLARSGLAGPAAVVSAVSPGFLAASGFALLGAITSFTRTAPPAGD